MNKMTAYSAGVNYLATIEKNSNVAVPIPLPHTVTDDKHHCFQGYAPRGWTRQIADIIEPFIDVGQSDSSDTCADVMSLLETYDYLKLYGLDCEASVQLLNCLPNRALDDRQNNAPSLHCLLDMCVHGGSDIDLSGYVITPLRCDERISIDALMVYRFGNSSCDIAGMTPEEVWKHVVELGNMQCFATSPDEIIWRRPFWAPHRQGWWIWWD
ncbi:MAG: hypothetical protein Q4P66_09310 [Actinomycetaceae bacterium]|nr:hypothetical protein [Actinomycetaceae bacterium]